MRGGESRGRREEVDQNPSMMTSEWKSLTTSNLKRDTGHWGRMHYLVSSRCLGLFQISPCQDDVPMELVNFRIKNFISVYGHATLNTPDPV